MYNYVLKVGIQHMHLENWYFHSIVYSTHAHLISPRCLRRMVMVLVLLYMYIQCTCVLVV